MDRRKALFIDVVMPGPLNPIRAALASCAIENNQFAIDALETIRRVEEGEPVGPKYAQRLNAFMLMNRSTPQYCRTAFIRYEL